MTIIYLLNILLLSSTPVIPDCVQNSSIGKFETIADLSFDQLIKNSQRNDAEKEYCCDWGKGYNLHKQSDHQVKVVHIQPTACSNHYLKLKRGIARAIQNRQQKLIYQNDNRINWKKIGKESYIGNPYGNSFRFQAILMKDHWEPSDPVEEAICIGDLKLIQFLSKRCLKFKHKESICVGRYSDPKLTRFLIRNGVSKHRIFIGSIIWNQKGLFDQLIDQVDLNKPLYSSIVERPLFFAINLGRVDMVRDLLKYGVKVKGNKYLNGLKEVIERNILRTYIQFYPIKDQRALEKKIYSGGKDLKIMKLLLEKSSLEVINEFEPYDQTILDQFIEKKGKDMIKLLRQYDAKRYKELKRDRK